MNENTRVHYQTSFRAKANNPEHSALFTLQNIAFSWLYKKERDKRISSNKKAFITKCEWSNLYRTYSGIATSTYYSDEGKCWAMRYTHLDGELGRKRYWYVDIGIREITATNEAIFYCKISYARDEYDLRSTELPIPSSNTPRFIRDILKPKSGLKVYSQNQEFGLYSQPVPFRLTYGQGLAELIESPKRCYALIVFNSSDEAMQKEAIKLSRELAGKAQVFTLDQDPEFAEELRHCMRRDLIVRHNTYRVFFPLRRNRVDSGRHRWFYITDQDYPEQRTALINSLLKNYNLIEDSAVKNISEISRMISRANLLSSLKAGDDSEAQLNAFLDDFTKLEEEKAAVEKERDDWLEECDERESQITELTMKLSALSHHDTQKRDQLQVCYKTHFTQLPKTLEDTVRVKAVILKERIVFTDDAFKSAADYSRCQSLDHAWKILFHIGTTLYDIKYSGQPVGDIEKRFKELSGYEYAKTEGQNTKHDNRLKQSRKFKYDDRDFELWSHIKYGVEEPKLLRIYFDYDDQNKKIIVGHVGVHLDNASTRKKR
tara:strand:- start:161 stop:1795 length:1635 start_codon:yes stop_codon:yes gene_type:complete